MTRSLARTRGRRGAGGGSPGAGDRGGLRQLRVIGLRRPGFNWAYLLLLVMPFVVLCRHRRRPGLERRLPTRSAAHARSHIHHRGEDMSQAATAHAVVEPAETPLTPDSWGKLGMWIFLAGDAVGFGTLLAAYGIMRATSGDWPDPYEVLGINLTAAHDVPADLLERHDGQGAGVAGQGRPGPLQEVSLLHRAGRRHLREPAGLRVDAPHPSGAAHQRQSLGRGAVRDLVLPGHRLPRSARHRRRHLSPRRPRSSVARRPPAASYNMVEIVGLYWHFVDLVWIMVFTFMYLL